MLTKAKLLKLVEKRIRQVYRHDHILTDALATYDSLTDIWKERLLRGWSCQIQRLGTLEVVETDGRKDVLFIPLPSLLKALNQDQGEQHGND